MRADPRFVQATPEFWAHVRTISQSIGYTKRGTKSISTPSLAEVRQSFERLGLNVAHIASDDNALTDFGLLLFAYFEFRAQVLNETVQALLMNKDAAELELHA